MAGQTAGPIKTKLGIGTHVDPRSVLVKVNVKVIYLCMRYNRINACNTWRITMKHAHSSSSTVAGATWWMLIKLLTSAGQRPARAERIRTCSRDSLLHPEDRYLQLVLLYFSKVLTFNSAVSPELVQSSVLAPQSSSTLATFIKPWIHVEM